MYFSLSVLSFFLGPIALFPPSFLSVEWGRGVSHMSTILIVTWCLNNTEILKYLEMHVVKCEQLSFLQ